MDAAGEADASEHDAQARTPDEHATDNSNVQSNGHNGVETEPQAVANGGPPELLKEPTHASEHRDESDEADEDGDGDADEADESEDESGSEGEDEDEDDEEPALKYDLLGGSTASLLQKDSASALAVCSKFVVRITTVATFPICRTLFTLCSPLQAMGTHAGIVHALDFSGNRVKSFRPHSASIIDLCVDSN